MQFKLTRTRLPAAGPALLALLLTLGSCSDQILMVQIARVEVAPGSTTVRIGATTSLTARLLGPEGEVLSGHPVSWRSLDTGIAQVDENGTVRGIAAGVTTIEASSNGASGSASVTVTTGPVIALGAEGVEFTAVWNGATPGDRSVTVQNAGDGVLAGLAATVRYAAGQPTGWLSASVSPVAPGTLVLSAGPAGLAPGTYDAFVDVSAPDAANSPRTVPVRLTVTLPAPAIALGTTSVAFVKPVGGAEPAEQTVSITNSGGGTLGGLAASVDYAPGQPVGWLAATLTSTTAPAAVVLRATAGSLPVGTYSATVRVTSGVAQNSPQAIQVQLTVSASAPAIALSPAALVFTAPQGNVSPPAQAVQITNAAGGALTGIVTSVTYPGGQPAGWLSLQLSGTNAPTSLIVTVQPAGLPRGTYSATISVAAPGAVNSPRQLPVTLTIGEALPVITPTPSTVTFTSTSVGTANPPPVQVGITNSGGGSLTGLAATITYPAGAPAGWLAAQLSGTTAPASLTLAASRGTLPVGTYSATVHLSAAGAQPVSIPVQYVIAVAAPNAPAAASAVAVQHDRIEITWSHQGGNADRFEIDRSTDGGANWTATFTASSSVDHFSDVGLASSTLYTYRVRACNLVGCSAYTPLTSATTAPAPPTSLTATPVAPTRVRLTWTDASQDETGFIIERAAAGGAWIIIGQAPANATAFDDLQATASTTYGYRVSACRGALCSGPGNIAQATTPAAPPPAPSAPGNLQAVPTSPSSITVSWAASTGTVAQYHVERSTTAGGGFTEVAAVPGTQTSWQDTGLAAATTYHYRVRASNVTGSSAYSPEASATTPAAPPPAPSAPGSFAAAGSSTSTISLSWNHDGEAATRFEIERAPADQPASFTAVASVSGAARTHTDGSLAAGSTYHYRIRACNQTGCSAWAGPASATTQAVVASPSIPTNVSATAVSPTQVQVTWSPSTGHTRYEVRRRTGTGGGWEEGVAVSPESNSYLDSVLPASTYQYQVRACSVTCSDYSAPQTVTTPAGQEPAADVALTSSAGLVRAVAMGGGRH